ncbi:GNAT family N-acetyltransferase [Lutibaculum baratangense]|nr:GNAT family N-acetyltransferase [Lutibaculum baratangense]
MPDATLRVAEAEDMPALHEVLLSLARHLGDGESFRSTPEILLKYGFGKGPLFRALVAETGGSICGAAVFFAEFSTLRGAPGVYVQDLWVAEPQRGSGLGRRMLASVMREARSWDAAYLKLATHAKNPAAIRFYERLGVVTDRDEITFVIEGEAWARLETGA